MEDFWYLREKNRCLISAIPVKVKEREESEYNLKQWCYLFLWGRGENKVNIKNILALGSSDRIVHFQSSPWMKVTEAAQICGQFVSAHYLISSADIVIVNALLSSWPFFHITRSSSFIEVKKLQVLLKLLFKCWIQLNFPLLRNEEGHAQAKTALSQGMAKAYLWVVCIMSSHRGWHPFSVYCYISTC